MLLAKVENPRNSLGFLRFLGLEDCPKKAEFDPILDNFSAWKVPPVSLYQRLTGLPARWESIVARH
jgi:hypothetical protein